jgi:hypothetical protein
MGVWPASERYLAVDSPARPAPMMTTLRGLAGLGAFLRRWESACASWKVPALSNAGFG